MKAGLPGEAQTLARCRTSCRNYRLLSGAPNSGVGRQCGCQESVGPAGVGEKSPHFCGLFVKRLIRACADHIKPSVFTQPRSKLPLDSPSTALTLSCAVRQRLTLSSVSSARHPSIPGLTGWPLPHCGSRRARSAASHTRTVPAGARSQPSRRRERSGTASISLNPAASIA